MIPVTPKQKYIYLVFFGRFVVLMNNNNNNKEKFILRRKMQKQTRGRK